MVERFEIEVDTTRANEYWNAEVEENLKARDLESGADESVSDHVPAKQH
jgi:3-ketosteroid 9alpha-monooxygenase subunit A